MIKKILIAIVLFALAGVAAGVYLWNKPHPKIEDAEVFTFTADSLAKVYSADEKAANAKYVGNNKAIKVSGTVDETSKNQDGATVITLATGDPMNEIQCTMADSTVKIAKGQNITVQCFCKGNNMGVILTDCVVK